MNHFIDLLQNPFFFYSYLIILSLCVGSFLNVAITRIPAMLNQEWRQQCCELLNQQIDKEGAKKINLFFPRSFCPSCNNTIKAWQNIPILSYLLLKGKCFYCKKKISPRYPLIELLTLVLSVIIGMKFGPTSLAIAGLIFIWWMITMTFIDIDHQILPDSLTLSLLWIGLIINSDGLLISLHDAVLSAAGAYLFLWIFIKIFYLATGKIGMGHGDFKLFAAFGAWFGWQQLPFILVLSSLIGAIFGIIILKLTAQDKDTPIPFGPYLCLAGFINLLWGKELMQWYLSTFVI